MSTAKSRAVWVATMFAALALAFAVSTAITACLTQPTEDTVQQIVTWGEFSCETAHLVCQFPLLTPSQRDVCNALVSRCFFNRKEKESAMPVMPAIMGDPDVFCPIEGMD